MGDNGHFELINCEATILEEIRAGAKRKDVAQTYALALRSSERIMIDWTRVNRAIMERWSVSALNWIKNKAHSGKCFDSERRKK